MGKRIVFLLLILVISLSGLAVAASCSKNAENIEKITIPAYSVPRFTSFEAIAFARQDAVDHPAWAPDVKSASFWASGNIRLSGLLWKAQYSGAGKWDVELRILSRDGIDVAVYRWAVYEDTMKAVYVVKWLETRWEATSPLATDDVIKITQTYGLPYIVSEGVASPVGTWSAVMISPEVWRVSGAVALTENGNTYQARAQWKYDGNSVILESLMRI